MELSLRNCQFKQAVFGSTHKLTSHTVNSTDMQNTEKFVTEFQLYIDRSQQQFSNQWKEKINLNNI